METPISNKITTITIIVLLVAAIGYIAWTNKITKNQPVNSSQATGAQPTTPEPLTQKDIQITSPLNAPLSGVATISGAARLVYFEGSFPVYVFDGAQQMWAGFATAQSDWMTTDYVPFQIELPTKQLPNGTYTLKLTQDDSSGEVPAADLYSVSAQITIQN